MNHYDIAAKALIESCRDELIHQFLGIEVHESTLIEQLPQETVSVKSSDFPVMVTDADGNARLVILEIQSQWRRYVPLNLLDYRIRYLLKQPIGITSCVVMLRLSGTATDLYEDEEVKFRFRLVKIYEMDAETAVENGPVCLLPFVPLMKGGATMVEKAENLIYGSETSNVRRADMLTSMAILSGLVSKDLTTALIARRKDIMIESVAYAIIKDEGMKEGVKEGIQIGEKRGLRQGLLESAKFILDTRFGIEGLKVFTRIHKLEEIDTLRLLIEAAKTAKSADELMLFVEDTSITG